ncbi:uncharacterized protein LOC134689576 [Mytilus trossulus]|uniref:uncharacterized protein LOC134689576 n=1 Tax=Mytilus trossulus TaxID=6551 RepID=UPI00300630EF
MQYRQRLGIVILCLGVTMLFCVFSQLSDYFTYRLVKVNSDAPDITASSIMSTAYISSLLISIESIRKDCGQLCDTTRTGLPGPFFDHILANVNCTSLFENKYIDNGHGLSQAPGQIPTELMNDFTMNGRIPLKKFYLNQQYLGQKDKKLLWSEKLIEDWIALAKRGQLNGNYGAIETNALRDGLQHAPNIKGGRVLVIGSEIPWVEACVLEAGAREVVTLEYAEIVSEHPRVKTILPYDFRMKFLHQKIELFDAVVTFSSVEHSGLGRYGDALNPWGDIIAISRAWCVTRAGGSLTIGVQYNFHDEFIRFNADRWYGKIRYPFLTTNWKQIYRGEGYQRVHVFTK